MDLRALIFVPALVGAAIAVFVFLLFAAHYYLTVLESTASGGREVTWLSESVTDNFWKPFYLAWLLCLWLGPAYIIGRSLAGSTGTTWLQLAVPVGVAWLLYPVSQLSSLSARSVWIPLHPQVFLRLAQKPMVLTGFFLFTLPVFALGGIAFKWAFLTKDEWHLLLVGMPLLVLAGFLYARLLGRLAFALMFTKDLLKRKKKKKPKKSSPRATRTREADEAESETEHHESTLTAGVTEPATVQPSDSAPISKPDGELTGYNILIADDALPSRKRVKAEAAEEVEPADPPAPSAEAAPTRRSSPAHDPSRTWTDEDDDATPYEAKSSEVEPGERVPEQLLKPTAEELALQDRRDVPRRPKAVWTSELFVFFGQPGTVAAMVVLTGIGAMAGVMVRVARMFDPTAGAE